MKLISYGLGNKFDIKKFNPIENIGFCKPKGGLWASPIDSEFGWVDWCKIEEFNLKKLSTHFEFEITGKILTINSHQDFIVLPMIDHFKIIKYLDFEKLAKKYDAIFLTLNGEEETRFTHPGLYGWDCESVLVMNPECVMI